MTAQRSSVDTPRASARRGCARRITIGVLLLAVVGVFAGGLALSALPNGWRDPVGAARGLLRGYALDAQSELLSAPAGLGTTPVVVTITPGQTAGQIARTLVTAGVLAPDRESLFVDYVTQERLDQNLYAGQYTLDPRSTIPEIAQQLQRNSPTEVTLTFLAGWRLEEMVAYLEAVQPARIRAAEFWSITQNPAGKVDRDLLSVTGGESLEGYLFPGNYTISVETDAATLISLMLQRFDTQVSAEIEAGWRSLGLTPAMAVTVASIVQREAVEAAEMPLIAGVFLNRLQREMRLEADPTVQYAIGYQADIDSWWRSPLRAVDLQIDSPYNTYRHAGLPPSPIANPGLAALEAVAFPEPSNFLFFVAGCGDSGTIHYFSETYEEHLANVARCR